MDFVTRDNTYAAKPAGAEGSRGGGGEVAQVKFSLGYQYRQLFDTRTDSWRNDTG